MSVPGGNADTAFRVADRLKQQAGPWDVYGERTSSYEVHFDGKGVELIRGPILLEGYGVRLLQPLEGKTAVGFQASTDTSEQGVQAALTDAQGVARYSEFPAKEVRLPSGTGAGAPDPEIVDQGLWEDAPGSLAGYTAALFAEFEGKKDVVISFGSVKAKQTEVTMANSAGLSAGYSHTMVETEIAVKSFGGPEGAPAGEYWVTLSARRLEPDRLPQQALDWSRFARDARRAKSPPSGELAVVLPASVLGAILPGALGFKLSGRGELRKLSAAPGSSAGVEHLTVTDDGTIPWAAGSSPLDDEGTAQRQRTLISKGVTSEILYDVLHGSALGHPSSGNGLRSESFDLAGSHRFAQVPRPSCTTLAIGPGEGGTDEELVEAAGDGIWVQQLGWASPDGLTTAFGGEIRIGYRIRNGKLAEPIRGGTLGGVVLAPPGAPSLFANIAGVGSRPELTGGVRVPTLLIRPLTVAGDDVTGATPGA